MPQRGNDGKKVLERISRETGGRMFEVSKKDPIEKIYAQIEEELRNQYSLGYTPNRAADAPSGYHKLHVATKEKPSVLAHIELGDFLVLSDGHVDVRF